jgi:deoxyribodipyrimidine photo-lyase
VTRELAVVWFKRDLRVTDHRPLRVAYDLTRQILPLFILEPSWRTYADYAPIHEAFLLECLLSLDVELKERGLELQVVEAEALETFQVIGARYNSFTILSYNEHGNRLTFERDRKVAHWVGTLSRGGDGESSGDPVKLHEGSVQWREFQTNGVERGRHDRDGWARQWQKTMVSVQEPGIPQGAFEFGAGVLPSLPGRVSAGELRVRHCDLVAQHRWIERQIGGRDAGMRTSDAFFLGGVKSYRKGISKPLMSRSTCSRLSPYLSFGVFSMREVYQRSQQEINRCEPSERWSVTTNMRAFQSRLHWHCHFIQKFESECRIEFENFNREFDVLRNEWNEELYQAWEQGNTGFPLLDASMRCVRATGYLNFRSRAMVVSFLTHLLWLDWRKGAHYLARCFLDYEPGIHYPQVQMQATTTGIHTIRIYNPVKQAEEHDTEAEFIKAWLPELRALPCALAREPWKVTPFEGLMYGFTLGKDYPHRCIDLGQRATFARDTLWRFQKKAPVVVAGQAIVRKHRGKA